MSLGVPVPTAPPPFAAGLHRRAREEVGRLLSQLQVPMATRGAILATKIHDVCAPRAAAGWTQGREITLNVPLCQRPEDYYDTLIHEWAHVVAYALYNDGGHGRGWAAVMRRLGRNPERLCPQERREALVQLAPGRYTYAVCPQGHRTVVGPGIARGLRAQAAGQPLQTRAGRRVVGYYCPDCLERGRREHIQLEGCR